MRALRPLEKQLQRSLWFGVARRLIAWGACALIAMTLEGLLSHLLPLGRVLRLGINLVMFSFLPVFLLWPFDDKRLTKRLRTLDDGMTFEAFLEAAPGPAREVLRGLVVEKASSIDLEEHPREPLLAGLRGFCGLAIASYILAELMSFLILGHSLALAPGQTPTGGIVARIEERGFSEFATEDPSARRLRREKALEQQEKGTAQGINPNLGKPKETADQIALPETQSGTGKQSAPPMTKASMKESLAKRRHGDEAEGSAPGSSSSAGMPPPGGSNRQAAREGQGTTPTASGDKAESGKNDAAPAPSRTGQGFEHTGDTKVPSPLLDYRSRFESSYAERTGQRVSASGRMGFGELRNYQRRYFDSFTLRADVGLVEDPYTALLKRRWTELMGSK
jgi:hypothetical protein